MRRGYKALPRYFLSQELGKIEPEHGKMWDVVDFVDIIITHFRKKHKSQAYTFHKLIGMGLLR